MRPASREARKLRTQLEHRRHDLLARYRAAQDRADEELSAHPVELVDVANDQWDARVVGLVSEADAAQLADIAGALRRLDGGTYGVCATCGGRIAAARLRVLPTAAECAHCAGFAESRPGRAARARYAAR